MVTRGKGCRGGIDWEFGINIHTVTFKIDNQGFPGGAVVKNPPANAGDTSSNPGPGRSHMLRSNLVHAPQLLSLHSTTTAARMPRACALHQERPPQ